MQHIHTFELLAGYRVEARLREAEHEAQLRLAREAAAARRPTGAPGTLRRIVHAVAARTIAAGGVG